MRVNEWDKSIKLVLLLFLISSTAFAQPKVINPPRYLTDKEVETGAEQVELWIPILKGKRVALVANHTSLINQTHLADTLLKLKVNLVKVFAPEHGFRGMADAGEKVNSSIDAKTGLPLISLYGKNKKPTAEQLADVDIVIFDIQDVGARFYTYISTMTYVMEACAESNKMMIVLDRPNPNGFYIDGPVLETKHASFVGLHPVPVVHGCTVGEYAQMVNGEKWISKKCELTVIKAKNYTHRDFYKITVPPSPNLKTMNSIYLYPSLCFFEGTMVSVGRGTSQPFELIGFPGSAVGDTTFKPISLPGSKNPPHLNTLCRGFNLNGFGERIIKNQRALYLFWLVNLYEKGGKKQGFFNDFFLKLAGTNQLQKQIEAGESEEKIRQSWQADLKKYQIMRSKYLLYEDF
jgi:uncharacterized protein YbbC (DUF1343 family)